jgi:extradiol dioxygenase family protein
MKSIIDRIDHLVLTVTDIEATTQFYEKALGFEVNLVTPYALGNIKLIYKIELLKHQLKQKYPLLALAIFV